MSRLRIPAATLLAAIVAPFVAAAPIPAPVCPVLCQGLGPHDAELALALACAGPGGTVAVSGACRIEAPLTLNQPGQILAGGCSASLERILPAPAPSFLRPSAALLLASGASGAVVRDLSIRGAGDGIATSPASSLAPSGQPDDVVIRNCRVEAGLQFAGGAINHFGINGPPFNDVDRCTSKPAGLATGWIIEDNDLVSHRGMGLRHGGSSFLVRRNRVLATTQGIVAENNARSTLVVPFGAPPSNRDNSYRDNVVIVIANAPTSDPAIGLRDDGFPESPVSPPAADGCDRGDTTLWRGNWVAVTPWGDGSYAIGAYVGGQGNARGSVIVEENRFVLDRPLHPPLVGNVGLQTVGTRHALVRHNDFVGAGDYPFLSLSGDALGNRYEHNRFAPGFLDLGHFVHDFGVFHSNCYRENSYCEAHEELEGDGADPSCGVNRPGKLCDGLQLTEPRAPRGARCAGSAPVSSGK